MDDTRRTSLMGSGFGTPLNKRNAIKWAAIGAVLPSRVQNSLSGSVPSSLLNRNKPTTAVSIIDGFNDSGRVLTAQGYMPSAKDIASQETGGTSDEYDLFKSSASNVLANINDNHSSPFDDGVKTHMQRFNAKVVEAKYQQRLTEISRSSPKVYSGRAPKGGSARKELTPKAKTDFSDASNGSRMHKTRHKGNKIVLNSNDVVQKPPSSFPPTTTVFNFSPTTTILQTNSPPIPALPLSKVILKKEETEEIFQVLRDEINDPDRIHAPTFCLIPYLSFTHEGSSCTMESSLSLCAKHNGRTLCAPVLPLAAASLLNSVFCCIQGKLYYEIRNPIENGGKASGDAARAARHDANIVGYFFCKLFDEFEEVEVITYHSSCLILPLLAYRAYESERARGTLSISPSSTNVSNVLCTNRITDLRTMSWMLNPNSLCDDYDSIQLSFGIQSSLFNIHGDASTRNGILARLQSMLTLYRKLYGTLGTSGLLRAFLNPEKGVGMLCTIMKFNGFCVDTSVVEAQRSIAEKKMESLKEEALEFVPLTMKPFFNIQSTDHIRDMLYTHLSLEEKLMSSTASASTKGGKLSTAEEALKTLSNFHTFPSIVLQYRKIAKLFQAYFDGVLHPDALYPYVEISQVTSTLEGESDSSAPSLVSVKAHPRLKCTHASFLQEATDTGRLSCVDPNLQSLPRCSNDNELASSIRKSFVPRPGHTLVTIDYEQIELRVLAHFCQDTTMMRALTSLNDMESDIHRQIAATVFQKPISAVSIDERTEAKRVVFGVVYGMGAKALAAQLGIPLERATFIQNEFRKRFPMIERFNQKTIETCRVEKGVRTLSGRFRSIPEITDQSQETRKLAERKALNTVIQGSAADIVKKAMTLVHFDVLLPACSGVYCARPLLVGQVHDELIFSIPSNMLSELVPKLRSTMTSCFHLTVPLRVSVKYGPSLGDLCDWPIEGDLNLLDI